MSESTGGTAGDGTLSRVPYPELRWDAYRGRSRRRPGWSARVASRPAGRAERRRLVMTRLVVIRLRAADFGSRAGPGLFRCGPVSSAVPNRVAVGQPGLDSLLDATRRQLGTVRVGSRAAPCVLQGQAGVLAPRYARAQRPLRLSRPDSAGRPIETGSTSCRPSTPTTSSRRVYAEPTTPPKTVCDAPGADVGYVCRCGGREAE